MAKKGNRVQVILECTEHKSSGQPGTSRYITTKNRKNTSERITDFVNGRFPPHEHHEFRGRGASLPFPTA